MSTGKAVVQGAHASVLASEKVRRLMPSVWHAWFNEGQRKIACKVASEDDLLAIKAKAEKSGIPAALVRDAGLTELEPGTITALGLGPTLESDMDPVTGGLKLY